MDSQNKPVVMKEKKITRLLSFDQIIRLIVCLSGVVFFGVGIWMINDGISAQGVIDIKMEVLTGHLETGSAGLFVTFFAFSMIVVSFLVGRHPTPSEPKIKNKKPSKMPVMVSVTVILWAVDITCYIIQRNSKIEGESSVFTTLAGSFLGIAIVFSLLTFDVWNKEVNERRNREP